jgi:hypothetical protein
LIREKRPDSREAEGRHQCRMIDFGDRKRPTVGSALRHGIGSNQRFCRLKTLLEIAIRITSIRIRLPASVIQFCVL